MYNGGVVSQRYTGRTDRIRRGRYASSDFLFCGVGWGGVALCETSNPMSQSCNYFDDRLKYLSLKLWVQNMAIDKNIVTRDKNVFCRKYFQVENKMRRLYLSHTTNPYKEKSINLNTLINKKVLLHERKRHAVRTAQPYWSWLRGGRG